MKKILIAAFILFLLVLPIFIFRTQVQSAFDSIYYYSPCDTPITYSIGTIDSGFNTTSEELLEDSKIAASIWNKALNKNLLEYDPSASFTINMVYDNRQELTSKINDLSEDLKQKQSKIDPKIEDYKVRKLEFEKKVQSLNADISYWNSQGGAPKEEYDKLIARQEELKKEADALTAEAEFLGQETSDYNSSARYLNSTIDDYQGILVTKPEEGLYEQDGKDRKISIYIDVSHDEFLHTLTHEFGHSLGLDHNINPESVMYPQTSDVLTPSNEEIKELESICKRRTTIEVVATRFTNVIEVVKERFEDRKAN